MIVYFLCRQNAGRSQMAAAFFERAAPEHRAVSGGSSPAVHVHPEVVAAMREIGYELGGRKPAKVDRLAERLRSAAPRGPASQAR